MADNIFFDFDGTIFNTLEGITKSVRYALNLHGVDEPLENLRCFVGPPLVDMFMEHNGFSRDEAEQAVRDFRVRYKPVGLYECCLFDGMQELICALKESGKKLAVATSKPQSMAETLLARENLLPLFDVVCGSGETGNNISKAEILAKAMSALGADRENSVLVGDTKFDVLGAKACGVRCVGVRYGFAAPGELEAAGADVIVDDVAALKECLLAL